MIDSADDPFVGRTIGQYQVLARVGGGGMGVVYTARAGKLGRLVALKFLPPQWSHDDTARQRFLREAQAASATNHPNICTIHDIETADDGQLFIVMAYYEGETLKTRLERGPLPLGEALEIASHVAEGLAKAHAQSVVHRDIKPGNLILTEDGVRILDFGLATFADALKLTTENAAVGTITYMSPEQVRGLPVDARSDVWAVGAVLYEMLTGHPPFQGSHAEAIAYAIRNEAPPLVRAQRPDVPEEVEQLVFRALHKDAAVRFQSGGALARALRHLRGLSVPLDLRTEAVVTPVPGHRKRSTRLWRVVIMASLAAVTLAGMAWGLLVTNQRTLVAIAPVANDTGYAQLDAFTPALTHALRYALTNAASIRVVGHDQQAVITRRFRRDGRDVPSSELLQALAANTSAPTLIVTTLLKVGDGWKARVEFRQSESATNRAVVETEAVPAALYKEAVYRDLIAAVAKQVDEHFATQSVRTRLVALLHRMTGGRDVAGLPFASLDALAAFEHGLDAYEEVEYATALEQFAKASELDPLGALAPAWQSRVARAMRHDVDSEVLARKAVERLGPATPNGDRLLVEAIDAEARRDVDAADARYRALSELRRDDPAGVLELASFLDRQGKNDAAIEAYLRARQMEPRLPQVDLALCQVYNRVPDRARARVHADAALTMFRTLGEKDGEAQTLLCQVDTKRSGDQAERQAAPADARAAIKLFTELEYRYGLARAYNYLGLALQPLGRPMEVMTALERSLSLARETGNTAIQARVLNNLGVVSESLGQRSKSADYYRQGFQLNEALGAQLSAARNMANAGALFIEYGMNPDQGQRDVQTALSVFLKTPDGHFEVFCHQLLAAYHRYAGRHPVAETELNIAESIAAKNNLDDEMALVNIDRARSRIATGHYPEAAALAEKAVASSSGSDAARARITLAHARTRMGDFDQATRLLSDVAADLERRGDPGLMPLWQLTTGVLEYERGSLATAREAFRRASAAWTDEWPDAAAVEAAGYAGLLDALSGRVAGGERELRRSLDHAVTMRRVELQAQIRLWLARVFMQAGRLDEMGRMLDAIGAADDTMGPELQAQHHYWRARLLRARGKPDEAATHDRAANDLLQSLRERLPVEWRSRFDARAAIATLH